MASPLAKGLFQKAIGESGAFFGSSLAVKPASEAQLAGEPHDGENPQMGLIFDGSGNLFGATEYGGANGAGVVYSVTPQGAEQVVYSFQKGTDAANPGPDLLKVGNVLYGVGTYGGANGYGAVFSLNP